MEVTRQTSQYPNDKAINMERKTIVESFPDRHPSVMANIKWLVPNSRLPQDQYAIAQAVESLGKIMLTRIEEDSAELAHGMRKLVEFKDCMVRASLEKTS